MIVLCLMARLHLYGVVAHTGFTLSCGHYTSYVRAPTCHTPQHPDNMDQSKPEAAHPQTVPQHPTSPDMEADPNNNQDSNNNVDTGLAPAPTDSGTRVVQSGCWFECDDEVITVLTEQEFLAKFAPGHSTTNTPYLLFYHRQN